MSGPILTWLRGRQRRAAAHCAGRCPCSVARGKLRAQPGWRSRGSCPRTGAASPLWGSRKGQSWHHLSSQATPFSVGLAVGSQGQGSGYKAGGTGPGDHGGAEPRTKMRWLRQKQLTHNHDIVPAVMVAEVEVAARGSVALDHQGRVQDVSLQDPHRPHSQEAQH